MSIIFDATTLLGWNRPPSGIVRVELEIAKYLLKHRKKYDVIFVSVSCKADSISQVSDDKVESVISKIEGNVRVVLAKEDNISTMGRVGGVITRYLRKATKAIIPDKYYNSAAHGLQAYKYHGFKIFFNKVMLYFYQRHSKSDDSYEIKAPLKSGDIFFVSHNGFTAPLYRHIKQKYGVIYMAIMHDMIPITHPNFIALSPQFFDRFYNYVHLIDKVVCTSNSTKKEFERAAKAYHFSKLPELRVIGLGSEAHGLVQKRTESASYKNYVLFVSTIEVRKNHTVLLKAWLEAKKRAIEMPRLVCVGTRGWLVDDLFDLYESSPYLKEMVVFLDNVDDATLTSLYKRCLFTVFPSYVEGFGLAASESLSYGKACIISTDGALNEATQGLMPRIAPDDVDGWMNKISELYSSLEARSALELKVKQRFRARTWDEFAEEAMGFG